MHQLAGLFQQDRTPPAQHNSNSKQRGGANGGKTGAHQISIEKQSLIEDVLAAHFTAEKKLSPNERRSTELHRLCQEVETESVREMLMKCIKPEMLYYFVQTSFDSFSVHQARIEEGLFSFDELN